MKKFGIQVAALVILIFVASYFTFKTNYGVGQLTGTIPQSHTPSNVSVVQIGDTKINVELADTPEKRGKGLGGRDSLDPNSGMLFTFDKPGKYQFWMKGMKFPLDFIWINGSRVADILPNIQPPAPNEPDSQLDIYEPVTEVDKVLEVNAGFAASHNIKVGDSVEYLNQ